MEEEKINLAKELYERDNVKELIEFIAETYPKGTVRYMIYGSIYDNTKATDGEVDSLHKLQIMGTQDGSVHECFNVISIRLMYLMSDKPSATGWDVDVYNYFQKADGSWWVGLPDHNEHGTIFEEISLNKVVNHATEHIYNDKYKMSYMDKKLSDSIVDDIENVVDMIGFISNNFTQEKNPLCQHGAMYRRVNVDFKSVRAILNDIGMYPIEDYINYRENEEYCNVLLNIPVNTRMVRTNSILFEFNGIYYELYKKLNQPQRWILTYNNVIIDNTLPVIKNYLKSVLEMQFGVSKFSELYTIMEEENPDFISGFKDAFDAYAMNSMITRPLFRLAGFLDHGEADDTKPQYYSAVPTVIGKMVSHEVLMENITNSNYVRFCFSEFGPLSTWLDASYNIYLKGTTFDNKILVFENLEDYNKALSKYHIDRENRY